MRKYALLLALSVVAVSATSFVTPASAQATRTWVSGVGDDVNPCSRTAPCKTWAGAISKTAPGGEISVLDPGGFGAVTITKSISLINDYSGEAGILASAGTGVTINAGANDIVILRGLVIDGAPPTAPGLNGIKFNTGRVLHVQKCLIKNFTGAAPNGNGILFAPSAGGSELYVSDTYISDNGTDATNGGIVYRPAAGGGGNISISRTQIENNSSGVIVDAGASTVGGISSTIRDSVVAGSSNNGITGVSTAGHPAVAIMVDNVTLIFNVGSGINANGVTGSGQGSAIVRVGRSTISNNVTGVSSTGAGPGQVKSYGTNQLNGNGADGAFTLPNLGQL